MIAPEMIGRFNEMLITDECPIRIYKSPHNDWSYEIKVVQHPLVEDFSLVYPKKQFYELLNSYFSTHGIKLTYNNTAQSFWVD